MLPRKNEGKKITLQTGVANSSEEEKVDSGYDGKEKSVLVTFSIREQAFRVRLGLRRRINSSWEQRRFCGQRGKIIERKAKYD